MKIIKPIIVLTVKVRITAGITQPWQTVLYRLEVRPRSLSEIDKPYSLHTSLKMSIRLRTKSVQLLLCILEERYQWSWQQGRIFHFLFPSFSRSLSLSLANCVRNDDNNGGDNYNDNDNDNSSNGSNGSNDSNDINGNNNGYGKNKKTNNSNNIGMVDDDDSEVYRCRCW